MYFYEMKLRKNHTLESVLSDLELAMDAINDVSLHFTYPTFRMFQKITEILQYLYV